MSEAQKYQCYCGTETLLKKDGTPWKHETPLGSACFGSSDPEADLTDVKTTKYKFEMLIYPNPELLEDPLWQLANIRMATDTAAKNGYVPTGEAVLKKKEPVGNKLRLVYEVPVKKG